MAEYLTYETPRRYPAVVTDRYGRFEADLLHDGGTYTLALRGNLFENTFINSLVVKGPQAATAQPPELQDVGLTGGPGDPAVVSAAGPSSSSTTAALRAYGVREQPNPTADN